MARLAIVWRNPNQVKKEWRCRQLPNRANLNVYVVEELISVQENYWVSTAAFELIRNSEPKRSKEARQRKWMFGFVS
jgi:hypothetical protein